MEVQMGDQPEQPQPQPQPQQGARKKRTATRLVDSEEPQEIDFNDLGQHCGDKQIKFGNECGVLTRSRISINYQTWKEVPQPQRDMLWLTIKRRWTNLNNNNKGDVLKICNTTWKSFKKRLKRDFLDTGRDPLPVFPYLDAKTWEKFKADRSSKEFQVRSEKASKNAKLQKNPARLGPHGYRGKKAEWEKEIASGGLLPELYKIKSQRTRDFVMGRLSKDDRGLYKAPPNMQPIMTELVEVENQICEGDWVPGPGEDSLTAVLGREHPGRTRAVGHTVGLRKAMQGFEQKKKKDQVKESMDEMRNKLEGVTGEVAGLKTVIDELKKQLTNDVNPGVQNSSDGLTPILDAITEPTHCELMLPYGAMDQNCAIGMVFPYGNGLIHSLPLRENHMKVMIDKINTNLQSLPIPVPTDEVGNLQYAVGQIIQWPRNAICITKVQATKQHISTSSVLQKTARGGEAPGANQNISTSSVLQKTTTVGTKNNTRTQINKPRPIESLRERLKNNPLVYVVADYGIFQAGTFEFWVAQEEIFRLLSKKTIDVTIITAWQMILNLMARGKNKCSFINPHRITGGDCQKNPEDVVNYLVEAMRIHHAKHFLLAPYLQSEHWVLLVICPHTRTAYILDSSTGPTKKPVDTYYLVKRHVDTAFARYQKDTSDSISWILPECNQQLSNWECGYYVMKWMLDFVMVGQHGLLSKTDTPWNDETPIPEKTLVSIVATWASQFQRNYM